MYIYVNLSMNTVFVDYSQCICRLNVALDASSSSIKCLIPHSLDLIGFQRIEQKDTNIANIDYMHHKCA